MRNWWHECAVDPNSSCTGLSRVEDMDENIIVFDLRVNGFLLRGSWKFWKEFRTRKMDYFF
jgi:hypothetical protein